MFSYQVDIYEKQGTAWGWYTLTGWTRPFTDGTRLDETLDGGTINLSCVTRQKAIKPFTRLRFIVSENGTEKERIYRLVASARRTRRKYAGTPLYDWTINTIELTKLLERRLIDTMTVTKYLIKNGNNYPQVEMRPLLRTNGSTEPTVESEGFSSNYCIYTPCILGNSISIPSNRTAFNLPETHDFQSYHWAGCTVNIINGNSGEILHTETSQFYTEDFTFTPTSTGTIKITYIMRVRRTNTVTGDDSYINNITYEVYVETITAQSIKSQPTITSVCERLLSAGVTRRKGVEAQEFLLDPTFASEYDEILAPEFSFTNCTLFEALLQVGGHIHAIPRLVPRSTSDDTHYYVTFDKLGGDEQAPAELQNVIGNNRGEWDANTQYLYNDIVIYNGAYYWYKDRIGGIGILPTLTQHWQKINPLIYSESTIDVNDWCGQIDTPAQNLVNTEDVTGGSITELGNSFITVRTEEGQVEVDADNILIRTLKGQQQVLKLELGCIPQYDNGNTPVGDITPYLYESAEYKTLSSYWGSAYPYSKAWAIYYTQGGNTIEGLSFRIIPPTNVDNLFFKNYAIVNIINAKTGLSLGVVDGEFMRKLAFRVTYVPIAQARVKAHKPSLVESGTVNNALTYNQSANIAETSYYGEKMRGAIARLGHDVETRTYDIFHYDQLPKVGQLLDGKYIAHIDYEWDITKVRITVALTKDFNMLSQFVGLNSNYRLYDISEKQSVERNVNYDELVVVGDAPAVDMQQYLMNRQNAEMVRETIRGRGIFRKLQVSRLTPYDTDGNEIPNRRVILPTVAFPFGTSIALNVSYFDNYGAGYQQSDAYESEANKSVQRLVPYTDSFGEIAGLKVSFDKETGWTQDSASAYDDGTPAMMYPQLLTADTGSQYVTTGDNLLNVQKDSREILNFTYQLHFVSTRTSIVIGSGLARFNPYVYGGSVGTRRFILLDHTINGLNRYLENPILAQAYADIDITPLTGNIYTVDPNQQSRDNQAKAWALCKEVTIGNQTKYELIVGENVDYSTTPTLPTVSFAGAIMQACNQDEPTRLQFINGTEIYYVYDESTNEMTMTGTIQGTWAVDTINVFLHEREGYVPTRYYAIHGYTDSTITTPQTVYILQATARNRLVSAYDFE